MIRSQSFCVLHSKLACFIWISFLLVWASAFFGLHSFTKSVCACLSASTVLLTLSCSLCPSGMVFFILPVTSVSEGATKALPFFNVSQLRAVFPPLPVPTPALCPHSPWSFLSRDVHLPVLNWSAQ